MKRNYRITICATRQEWECIHFLAFRERQTPATTAYLLMQDSLVRRIDPGSQEGRAWAEHEGRMKVAAYETRKGTT